MDVSLQGRELRLDGADCVLIGDLVSSHLSPKAHFPFKLPFHAATSKPSKCSVSIMVPASLHDWLNGRND